VILGLSLGAFLVCEAANGNESRNSERAPPVPGQRMAPDGTGHPVLPDATRKAASTAAIVGSGINYNGGPVMAGFTPNIYLIWYGNWAQSSGTYALSNGQAQAILSYLAANIGGSGYYNTNSTYYQPSGSAKTFVLNNVMPVTQVFDNYSQGTSLSDTSIQLIVKNAINNKVPLDPNGIYFVLTSGDINKSGFGTRYCGWHTAAELSTKKGSANIKYSFVGNPFPKYPTSCAIQTTTSPNGNVAADAMASVFVHELEEAVTDPNLNAWYDSSGYENADKCAWNFGSASSTPSSYTKFGKSGGSYNITLGSDVSTTYWMIQQNWVNQGSGYCAKAY
jgi:hypothetical protein